MDLKMEVYTPGLELIGVLEGYRSVLWDEYAFKSGSFSVESLMTPTTVALLTPENILWIEGETAGIIEYVRESVGEDGPYITAKGPLLTGLLERRILWGRYDLYGIPSKLMYELVRDCAVEPTRGDMEKRKLPGLVLDDAPPTGAGSVRKQKTGGSLLGAMEEIGEAHQTAFGVRFNAQRPYMEFWSRQGVDRSIHQSVNESVFYSTELDDVLSSEYFYDASEHKNVALVAGEGMGADRVYVTAVTGEAEQPNVVAFIPQGDTAAMQTVDGKEFTAQTIPESTVNVYRSAYTGSEIDTAIGRMLSGGCEAYQFGDGLKLDGSILSVDTAGKVERDNTKPVTSAAVYTEIGNIEVLLAAL